MFERFSAGFSAAQDCWEVLKSDKKLIVLPFLSGLFCLVVLASFVVPLAVLKPHVLDPVLQQNPAAGAKQEPIWLYGVAFLFYFCNYAVIYFFNSALVCCAIFHFRGRPITVTEGLQAAGRRLPQILAWALVSATVGVLLKIVENAHEKAGAIISAVLGTAWTIVTYFVVPVLVVERVGPFEAIRRSSRILRDTWGQALGGRMGLGWFLLPFWLIALVMGVAGVFLMQTNVPLGILLCALTVLYGMILGLMHSALETILLAALYLYATQGEVPEGMSQKTFKKAFAAK
jgi:hypothetical protein